MNVNAWATCVASRKIRYATELHAEVALSNIEKKRREAHLPKRRESRTYHCEACGGWHLTSGVPRAPVRPIDAIAEEQQ